MVSTVRLIFYTLNTLFAAANFIVGVDVVHSAITHRSLSQGIGGIFYLLVFAVLLRIMIKE